MYNSVEINSFDMAIVETNALVRGFRGRLGQNLILRTVRGKVVASNRSHKPQKESQAQKANRDRFREASRFAKAMMQNADKKKYYRHKAQ